MQYVEFAAYYPLHIECVLIQLSRLTIEYGPLHVETLRKSYMCTNRHLKDVILDVASVVALGPRRGMAEDDRCARDL